MKNPTASAVIAVLLASFLRAQPPQAVPEDLTLVFPGGISNAVRQLIPDFEHKTGINVRTKEGSGTSTRKQAANGDPFDVMILEVPCPEVLASGNVIASSATPLAIGRLGVVVKQGMPRPDISTAAALRTTLLAAKFVSYPNPVHGAETGMSFEETVRKLGIALQMQPKMKPSPGGRGDAMRMVVRGEADLGVTFLSEMDVPGIDIVGPLPEDVSPPFHFAGFVSSHAANPAAAKALLTFLSAPTSAAAYRAQRMQQTLPSDH